MLQTYLLHDYCFYGQVLDNQRFNVDVEPFPRTIEIANRCADLESFRAAEPARQPDAS